MDALVSNSLKESLLDICGLAERLAVSKRSVERIIARGEIPRIHIGRNVRFDPGDVDRYIAERRAPAAASSERQLVVVGNTTDRQSMFTRNSSGRGQRVRR